jgi:hypothetical protein
MTDFDPQLQILPAPQRCLWEELRQVPGDFVLYGGTAIALYLAHRTSEDFDLFSSRAFSPMDLFAQVPFLAGGTLLQSAPNTVTALFDRQGLVKVSFFGALTLGRVGVPARALDIGLAVASKLDLAATKAKVLIERAERKDYLDLAALLKSGITLPEALGAARALYGGQFHPMIALRALSYFGDGDLSRLPLEVRTFLSEEAGRVTAIPEPARVSVEIAARR